MRRQESVARRVKVKDASGAHASPIVPPHFKVCDPAYSLCPDCAKALREGTCPKLKEQRREPAARR